MSTKTPNHKERIATADLLGVDEQGREHYWLHGGRVLFVIDDDEIAHVREDTAPGKWAAFVEEHVGWQTCHHADSLAELLEDAT